MRLQRIALIGLALTGCTSGPQLPGGFQLPTGVPTTSEIMEGNFRTLAACTQQRLEQRRIAARRTDPDASRVQIAAGDWQMSFVNDGQLTRVEMTSRGTQESDYALALARACAA
jgi:hypothetical protein